MEDHWRRDRASLPHFVLFASRSSRRVRRSASILDCLWGSRRARSSPDTRTTSASSGPDGFNARAARGIAKEPDGHLVRTYHAATRRLFAAMFDPIRRVPTFRCQWPNGVFYFYGSWAQIAILAQIAFDLTCSEFAVALFGLVGFAPYFLAPLGGLLGNRVE